MIYKSLELIRRNLEDYINARLKQQAEIRAEQTGEPEEEINEESVSFENVALLETLKEEAQHSSNILLSLVNIEEESTLKNNPLYRTTKINGEVDYHNPPIFLNLYLLVSVCHKQYEEAIKKLSLILQFFQSKKIFSVPNSFDPFRELETNKDNPIFSDEEKADIKLNLELFSMTFEQVNHLWGSLGGKQVPFALYVVRLVKIEDIQKQKGGGRILEVEINPS